MGLFERKDKSPKPPQRDAAGRAKDRGAREYEARREDRLAERLEAAGDTAAAQVARARAAELRGRATGNP